MLIQNFDIVNSYAIMCDSTDLGLEFWAFESLFQVYLHQINQKIDWEICFIYSNVLVHMQLMWLPHKALVNVPFLLLQPFAYTVPSVLALTTDILYRRIVYISF